MKTNKAFSEQERIKTIEEMIMHIPAIVCMLELMQGLISQGSDPGLGSGGFIRAPSGGR